MESFLVRAHEVGFQKTGFFALCWRLPIWLLGQQWALRHPARYRPVRILNFIFVEPSVAEFVDELDRLLKVFACRHKKQLTVIEPDKNAITRGLT